MDQVYPPFAPGWEAAKRAFPGRTLIVSNSAGSSKDRGGIGAEALSISLQAPVLAHRRPKPACAADVIDFFKGRLPLRTGRQLSPAIHTAQREEDEAEDLLLQRWRWEVEHGPLCGQLHRPYRDNDDLEAKMVAAQHAGPDRYDAEVEQPEKAEDEQALSAGREARTSAHDNEVEKQHQREAREAGLKLPATHDEEPLRVLVVGDRKFTDVLLARRLALYPDVVTLSIQNTAIPQPKDVRFLRRFEDWLAGPKDDPAGAPWEGYIRVDPPPPPPPTLAVRLSPKYILAEPGPPVIWYNPRTWRWRPILASTLTGLGHGIRWLTVESWRGLKAASVWTVAKIKQANENRKIRNAEKQKEAMAREQEAKVEDAKAEQGELAQVLEPEKVSIEHKGPTKEVKEVIPEDLKDTPKEKPADPPVLRRTGRKESIQLEV